MFFSFPSLFISQHVFHPPAANGTTSLDCLLLRRSPTTTTSSSPSSHLILTTQNSETFSRTTRVLSSIRCILFKPFHTISQSPSSPSNCYPNSHGHHRIPTASQSSSSKTTLLPPFSYYVALRSSSSATAYSQIPSTASPGPGPSCPSTPLHPAPFQISSSIGVDVHEQSGGTK